MKRVFILSMIIIGVLSLCLAIGGARASSGVPSVARPTIDGCVEQLWNEGVVFDSFVQLEPEVRAQATEQSEFFFMHDTDNIYFAARLYQGRHTIHSNRGKRDSDIIADGDYVIFILDPMNSGNMAYYFTVNPSNGVIDGNLLNDGTTLSEWDGIFHSETLVNDDCWSVELEIPLSTISFQDKEVQDWGVLFFRYLAEKQEKCVNQISDVNNPLRIDAFYKITGLSGLDKGSALTLTPYAYSAGERDMLSGTSGLDGKSGIDVKFSPSSSLTIAATANPDYAQLETDKEVINMSDLPTEYPEKRPFFIESNDFYQSAAVNTRNIVDIKTGLKLKRLGGLLNYDLTGVLDGDDNQWYLGDARLSNGNSYTLEIMGGVKLQEDRHDYNVTTYAAKWLFEKRLIVYNWTGTINRPGGSNQWETVNSFKWKTRTVYTGFWSHLKTEYYNPNIVGWNYLANETVLHAWFNYSLIRESGVLRKSTLELHANRYDLYTDRTRPMYITYLMLDNYFYVNPSLGMWNFSFTYSPSSRQHFRYRNVEGYDAGLVYEDAIGPFVLIDHPFDHWKAELLTDRTRMFGGRISYSGEDVRGSDAVNIDSEAWLRIGSSFLVSYNYARIDVAGSPYQPRLEQTIHRVKAEYNLTDRINARIIVQPNRLRMPDDDRYESTDTAVNVLLSWEYERGSCVYLLFNKSNSVERSVLFPERPIGEDQIIAVKISKAFNL